MEHAVRPRTRGKVVGSAAIPVTPQACARAVMEAVPLAMRFLRDQIRCQRASHLSVPQFRALTFLHRHPGACLFAVADHLGVSRPTASTIVDRLVRQGLVTRTEDPVERRRIVLGLTPSGTRHFQQAQDATRTWLAGILRRQSPAELGRIAEGVSLLAGAFQAVEVPRGQ